MAIHLDVVESVIELLKPPKLPAWSCFVCQFNKAIGLTTQYGFASISTAINVDFVEAWEINILLFFLDYFGPNDLLMLRVIKYFPVDRAIALVRPQLLDSSVAILPLESYLAFDL